MSLGKKVVKMSSSEPGERTKKKKKKAAPVMGFEQQILETEFPAKICNEHN